MTSAEPGQPRPTPTPPKRDWVVIIVTMLPGLAALIAVIFTYASVQATENQVQIARQGQNTAEQGQITDRYNAAITNLGSRSIDVRLGGIYALQRLMQDSPRDQPTVVAVLCAFVRDQTSAAAKPRKPPSLPPATDIQAALTVVGTRNPKNDGRRTVIDLDNTELTGADLSGLQLSRTDFSGANLGGAKLIGADLYNANLTHAKLTRADLYNANLTGASFTYADLTYANLLKANLTRAQLGPPFSTFRQTGPNVGSTRSVILVAPHAERIGANLSDAHLEGAILTGANLIGVNLTDANLTAADLTRANLIEAHLAGAILIANLTGANLAGAHLTGAYLTGANLAGAVWPAGAAVPQGWVRDTNSGRLKRLGT